MDMQPDRDDDMPMDLMMMPHMMQMGGPMNQEQIKKKHIVLMEQLDKLQNSLIKGIQKRYPAIPIQDITQFVQRAGQFMSIDEQYQICMKPGQIVNFLCSVVDPEFRVLPEVDQVLPQVELPREFNQLFESVKTEYEKSRNMKQSLPSKDKLKQQIDNMKRELEEIEGKIQALQEKK